MRDVIPQLDKRKSLEEQLDKVREILKKGKIEDVKKLVQSGLAYVTNIHLGDDDSAPDFTPLHYAALNKCTNVFVYLVEVLKLNPDAGTEVTPLLIAAHYGNYPVIRLLIEKYNVNTRKKNAFGKDVIDVLRSKHHFRYIGPVKRLIASQYNIDSENSTSSNFQNGSTSQTITHRSTTNYKQEDSDPEIAGTTITESNTDINKLKYKPAEENIFIRSLSLLSSLFFDKPNSYEEIPLLPDDEKSKHHSKQNKMQ